MLFKNRETINMTIAYNNYNDHIDVDIPIDMPDIDIELLKGFIDDSDNISDIKIYIKKKRGNYNGFKISIVNGHQNVMSSFEIIK